MRISYVRIENFRNFRFCEVKLGQNIVLVGENKAGKSNFIEALRLILDPSLSDADHFLTEQDFWDGIEPFQNNEIRITIQLTDFANDPHPNYLPLSLLNGSAIVDAGSNPVAQLTYLYFNSKQLDNPEQSGLDDYDYKIYPGNNPDDTFDIVKFRRNIPLQMITAIRDIARDNRSWGRSPLNRLVELAGLKVEQLEPFANRVRLVSDDVLNLSPLNNLQIDIQNKLKAMVGEIYTIDPQLGLNATTPKALEQDLRLFADGGKQRTLERTSLGLQNALYLALLDLFLEKQEIKRANFPERFMPIVALEEPEAHLHPHLQRLVFDYSLDRARQRKQPVIISTHSPHLACTSDVKELVLVKNVGKQGSKLRSTYEFVDSLESRDRKDLNRFLDITKAEMLFSKGVIFVEGDVEVLLVNEFAKIMAKPLDQYGIALCNAYGTNFTLLATFAYKIGVPFLILTDGDPETNYPGLVRGIDTLQNIIEPGIYDKLKAKYEANKHELVRRYLKLHGVYVNTWTLEPALIDAGLHEELKNVFTELGDEIGVRVRAGATHIDNYMNSPTVENMKKILTSIDDTRWGKGRFAHRLVGYIKDKVDSLDTQEEKEACVPQYIQSGINYIIGKVKTERVQI